jgi:IS1 family transposase
VKALLAPLGITRYHEDYWGAYTRQLDLEVHHPGKRLTQHSERKHLTLRAYIKWLVRKSSCFPKFIEMPDIVRMFYAATNSEKLSDSRYILA